MCVEQDDALADRVVEGVGGNAAAEGAGRDHHAARVGHGQVLVVGGAERGRMWGRITATHVFRVQLDVRAQFGRAFVQPAHLPSPARRPGEPEDGRAVHAAAPHPV